jgi:hypothetical protein
MGDALDIVLLFMHECASQGKRQAAGDTDMIKRIAVAAGIAALLGTSAAALAGSSITLSSTQLEQPKPVAVDGQWNVVDGLGAGMGTGHTVSTTAGTPVASSASTTVDGSVDIGTAIRVSVDDAEQVSEDDPRWDCHTMGNRICGQE